MEQLYISYSPTILSVQAFEEYKLLYASSNSGKVHESMLATVRGGHGLGDDPLPGDDENGGRERDPTCCWSGPPF